MSMRDAIQNFNKQFEYEPKIENAENFKVRKKFIVIGMGGSHWMADLLKTWKPSLDIVIHNNYGLPALADDVLENSLVVASSYSGNTEETIDGFHSARRKQLPLIVISTGGTLVDLAREHSVPYIQMPDTGIQPRSALGFSTRALLEAMGEEEGLAESRGLAGALDPGAYEDAGRAIAERTRGKVPVIYASARNASLAHVWKIKFNETGKIPAFANVFPELNHNEMTGFDVKDTTGKLSENFYFLILRDSEDHPSILKRMDVLERLYKDRGLPVEMVEIEGPSKFHKIFSSLILADWAAYYTAEQYGLESEQVPMVEEFKKMIAAD
jgi:glucose/mannose-6-phosphate isomerase